MKKQNRKIAFILFGFYESALSLANALTGRGIYVDVYCYITKLRKTEEFFGYKYSTLYPRFPGNIYEIDYSKSKGVKYAYKSNSHVYLMQGFYTGVSQTGYIKIILKSISVFFLKVLMRKFNKRKYDFVDFVPLGDFSHNLLPLIEAPHITSFHEISDTNYRVNDKIDDFVKCCIKRGETMRLFSNYTYKNLISLLGSDYPKIFVIPFGKFTNYLDFDEEAVPELGEEQNYILYFGMISPYKGINILYDAINQLPAEYKKNRIVVAGMGNDPIIEKMKRDKVFLVINRYINNSELVNLVKRSKFLICPYLNASQSGLPQVAYLFGKPMVVTKVGAFPQIVSNNRTGLVVEPNNAAELCNAIKKMLSDKELYYMLLKRIVKIEKVFPELSWNQIVDNYSNMIQSVLKSQIL